MTTDASADHVSADITLQDLWTEGLEALQQREAGPGTTYEIAPGVVGTMPYPTLALREFVREQEEKIGALFREDATLSDVRDMADPDDPDRQAEAAQASIRSGVTTRQFNETIQRAACEEAARLLSTDEEVLPGDCVTDMAAVVRLHFLALAPGTPNGQTPS